MPRDRIVIEDPLTEEDAMLIWKERLDQAKNALKDARQFVKETGLMNKDAIFIGALIKVLEGILSKKG